MIVNWAAQQDAIRKILERQDDEVSLFVKKLRFAGIEVFQLHDELIIDIREDQLDLYSALLNEHVGRLLSCEPGCDDPGASSGTTDSGRPKK